MQGLVKNLAQSADIKFTRISPGKSVEKDGFTEITLKLPFSGNIKQIAEFLYALESDPVFFNIKQLSIQRRRGRRKKEPLKVDLTIAAYIRTPEEKDSKSGSEDETS
jgi:Tfp pilus assembly protein PilO